MRLFDEGLDQQHGGTGGSDEELRDAPADGDLDERHANVNDDFDGALGVHSFQACFLLADEGTVAS
jgi:hypothetical protein